MQNAQTVVGTPYYMSPEICQNKPYSFKSDLWSLGCILYELASLKRPFEASNLLGLVNKITESSYSPIPSHFSQDLKNLIDTILIKDPIKRSSIIEIKNHPFIKSKSGSSLKKPDSSKEINSFQNRLFRDKMNLEKDFKKELSKIQNYDHQISKPKITRKENIQIHYDPEPKQQNQNYDMMVNEIDSFDVHDNSDDKSKMDITFQTEEFSQNPMSNQIGPNNIKKTPEDKKSGQAKVEDDDLEVSIK